MVGLAANSFEFVTTDNKQSRKTTGSSPSSSTTLKPLKCLWTSAISTSAALIMYTVGAVLFTPPCTCSYEPEDSSLNNERINPANYESNPLAVLGLEDDQVRGEKLFRFKPSSNASGFYLGIEGTGTCGSIERITVYY